MNKYIAIHNEPDFDYTDHQYKYIVYNCEADTLAQAIETFKDAIKLESYEFSSFSIYQKVA